MTTSGPLYISSFDTEGCGLQDIGERRTAFVASLETSIEEGRRVGFATLDEVEADVRAAIDEVRARRTRQRPSSRRGLRELR